MLLRELPIQSILASLSSRIQSQLRFCLATAARRNSSWSCLLLLAAASLDTRKEIEPSRPPSIIAPAAERLEVPLELPLVLPWRQIVQVSPTIPKAAACYQAHVGLFGHLLTFTSGCLSCMI
jgi:hypothetical protein